MGLFGCSGHVSLVAASASQGYLPTAQAYDFATAWAVRKTWTLIVGYHHSMQDLSFKKIVKALLKTALIGEPVCCCHAKIITCSAILETLNQINPPDLLQSHFQNGV